MGATPKLIKGWGRQTGGLIMGYYQYNIKL
jgi:hypothetical protein